VKEKFVVIVEDNRGDEELTTRALQGSGICHRLVVLRDGAQALDYFLGRENERPRPLPDLILLDLKIPKVGGLEVLKRLRADERTRLLPVVVLSSSTKPEDVIGAYRSGCNSYLNKEIDFSEFMEATKVLAQYWLTLNVVTVEEARVL